MPLSVQKGSSITALSVLSGFIVALENGYKDLFAPEELNIAKHLLQTAINAKKHYSLWAIEKTVSSLPYTTQRFFLNKVISKGYDLHKLMRKYFIKTFLEEMICEHGVQQVIYLGAGYDIRPYLLSLKYPEVNFFELDYGLTRQIKLQALQTLPLDYQQPGTNLKFIECNVIEDELMPAPLKHTPHKKVFVLEGLTMYLNKAENEQLLQKLVNILTDEDQIIISFSRRFRIASRK